MSMFVISFKTDMKKKGRSEPFAKISAFKQIQAWYGFKIVRRDPEKTI